MSSSRLAAVSLPRLIDLPFPPAQMPGRWPRMMATLRRALSRIALITEMHISNRRGYTWKSWLLLAPLSGAALVSVSRTMDYRHHATDVIAGALIGIFAAWFSYRQFYPVSRRLRAVVQLLLFPTSAHSPYTPSFPASPTLRPALVIPNSCFFSLSNHTAPLSNRCLGCSPTRDDIVQSRGWIASYQ